MHIVHEVHMRRHLLQVDIDCKLDAFNELKSTVATTNSNPFSHAKKPDR